MSFCLLLHTFLNASELLIVLTIHITFGFLAKYEAHFKIFPKIFDKGRFLGAVYKSKLFKGTLMQI